KAFAEFGNFCLAKLFALGIGSLCQFAFVDNVHRTFRAHDGDLRGGPGEIGIGSNMLRGHDAVRAAIGLAGDDGDFRDGGFGEGEKQLGAVPDDPAEFLLGARQEAGDILESNQRNIESVAKTNEAGTFDGSVDIEDDRKSTRLNSSHVEISYAVFCLKKKNDCTTAPTSTTERPNRL